jgi:hypothetical protein
VTLRHVRLAVAALAAAVAPLALGPAPARAGGTWLSPVQDRYEPGELATIVGYTQFGAEGGPYFGYLRVDPTAAFRNAPTDMWPFVDPTDKKLGTVQVQETERKGWDASRVVLQILLPHDLQAGTYEVVICNEGCTQGLGDIIGATVYVGIDPPQPLAREWRLDEPMIQVLDDDALLTGPGYLVTAAQVRSGTRIPEVGAPAYPDFEAGDPTAAAPAQPSDDDADVRLTPDDDGGGSSLPSGALWIAMGAVAAAAFLVLRSLGPRRKQVHIGSAPGAPATSDGQTPRRTPRWAKRVVRL